MNYNQEFEIKLAEPVFEQYYDPPDDPLGEYTEVEIGILTFCYECNQRFLLRIGNEEIRLSLYPDMSDALYEQLPRQVLELY